MDFTEIRDQYNELRRKERNIIVNYLRNHVFFKNKAKINARNGSQKYNSGQRLKTKYDLRNWLWIDLAINDVNFLLSLQTFDYDPKTGNLHVLMDRIGIYVYGDNYSAVDARENMMITNIELPLNENKLEELANIINKLSECELYKMQAQLAKIKKAYKLI